jgi:hypothetical protein
MQTITRIPVILIITFMIAGILGGCLSAEPTRELESGQATDSTMSAAIDENSVQETQTAAEITQTDAEIASASTVINHSCGPRIDPNFASHGSTVTVASTSLPNGGSVQLRRGLLSGQYIYWTRVVNNKTESLHLDWSDSGGSTYHICDENWFTDPNSAYTFAVNDPGGRVFKYFAFVGNWYGSSSWY